jgi:hypothetical protein
MRAFVLRAVALVACVVAVLMLLSVAVRGFVKADSADLPGLVSSLSQAGVVVSDAQFVHEDGVTVAAFTVRSRSTTDRVEAADKMAEESVLRQTQLFKEKGLKADEVAFAVLNQQGDTILSVRVPLDRPIDPAWYAQPASKDGEVEAWAKKVLADDPALKPLELASISVAVEEDGARALDLDLVVADLPSGQEAMTEIMRDFRWRVSDFNASKGSLIGLVRISIADRAGTPLAEYVADLQLQHDQAWLAKGVQAPGFGPAPAERSAQ